jgi:hypothetical protein
MQIDEILAKLKPLLGKDEVDKLWRTYVALSAKNRAMFERVLMLRLANSLGTTFEQEMILLEPPSKEAAFGEYELGSVCYGTEALHTFGLRESELIQHTAIFGRSGSGKTNVGFLFVLNLIKQNKPFLVFDWKRNYRDLLSLPECRSITVFTVGRNVAPFHFNPLEPPPDVQPTTWLKKLIEIMAHAYYLGEGCAFLLQKALAAVFKESTSQNRSPTIADLQEYLYRYKAKGRETGWMDSTLRAVGVLCFGEVGRVLNAKHMTPVQDILTKRVILELDALTNTDKTFLIEALLLWIHHFRLTQSERETFKHAIMIEEAHHILLRKKQEVTGSESVTDILLREIRELGEAVILLDQHPSLISKPALGNTYCTIAMNLKHRGDTRMVADCLHLDSEQTEHLTRLPVGYAVAKLQDRYFRPFLVKFPLVQITKGAVTDGIIQHLPEVHADEDEMPFELAGLQVRKDEAAFLQDIVAHRFSPVVERYARLGLSACKGNDIQRRLISKGLVTAELLSDGTRRWKVLCLSDKGREFLGLPEEGKRFGGIQHQFWVEKVANRLESAGYQVEREFPIGEGRTIDLVASKGGRKIAIEVETGNSDALSNIQKCLVAGFGLVICLTISKELTEKIIGQVRDSGLNLGTVKVVELSDGTGQENTFLKAIETVLK